MEQEQTKITAITGKPAILPTCFPTAKVQRLQFLTLTHTFNKNGFMNRVIGVISGSGAHLVPGIFSLPPVAINPSMGSHLTNLAAALTRKVKVTIPPNGGVTTCGAMVASEASMEHPHDAASPVAWMMTKMVTPPRN